jgi:hypothetical protein
VRMVVVVVVTGRDRMGQNSTHERESFSERVCRTFPGKRTATYLASAATTSDGSTSWPVWLLHEFFV